ncbi:MAG: HAD hydrolase family protein [Elusimicrobiaceae bacterium]|nr:HAD hydrolase family protein [Elusimicrobiaceae bacterium]
MTNAELKKRAGKIKLLLTDVDGVLTDGKLYFLPTPRGGFEEVKGFSALDGIGIMQLKAFGISSGIITGRNAQITVERAKMLSMKYVYMGFLSKLAPLQDLLRREKISSEEVAYIGDDVTDIPIMRKVGLACAAASATAETKKTAHYVTKAKGGEGAAREVCDLILRHKGLWKQVMARVEQARWDKNNARGLLVITELPAGR